MGLSTLYRFGLPQPLKFFSTHSLAIFCASAIWDRVIFFATRSLALAASLYSCDAAMLCHI